MTKIHSGLRISWYPFGLAGRAIWECRVYPETDSAWHPLFGVVGAVYPDPYGMGWCSNLHGLFVCPDLEAVQAAWWGTFPSLWHQGMDLHSNGKCSRARLLYASVEGALAGP